MRILKGSLKFFILLILSLLFIGSLFYLNTTIYNFPESQSFSGDSIFNPYQNNEKLKLNAIDCNLNIEANKLANIAIVNFVIKIFYSIQLVLMLLQRTYLFLYRSPQLQLWEQT